MATYGIFLTWVVPDIFGTQTWRKDSDRDASLSPYGYGKCSMTDFNYQMAQFKSSWTKKTSEIASICVEFESSCIITKTNRKKQQKKKVTSWSTETHPRPTIPPPRCCFFFSGFLSQQFPSLKLTAKAPENGGPLQKIRFLYWKPPFSGGGVALSFREVITLDSSLPPRMHGTRMLACVTCCATGSTWEQNDDAKSKSWRIQSAG